MKWADWKEQVQDSPRPFILTYLVGAAGGVIIIVVGGLMAASPSMDTSRYGYPIHRYPVVGVIVLGVGVLILSASIALTIMAVGYWAVERRRKKDEILHP